MCLASSFEDMHVCIPNAAGTPECLELLSAVSPFDSVGCKPPPTPPERRENGRPLLCLLAIGNNVATVIDGLGGSSSECTRVACGRVANSSDNESLVSLGARATLGSATSSDWMSKRKPITCQKRGVGAWAIHAGLYHAGPF